MVQCNRRKYWQTNDNSIETEIPSKAVQFRFDFISVFLLFCFVLFCFLFFSALFPRVLAPLEGPASEILSHHRDIFTPLPFPFSPSPFPPPPPLFGRLGLSWTAEDVEMNERRWNTAAQTADNERIVTTDVIELDGDELTSSLPSLTIELIRADYSSRLKGREWNGEGICSAPSVTCLIEMGGARAWRLIDLITWYQRRWCTNEGSQDRSVDPWQWRSIWKCREGKRTVNIVHLNMCWVTSALGVVCLSTRIRLIKSTCVTIRLCWRYPHRWTYYCTFLIKVATAQATANVKCIALIEFELHSGWMASVGSWANLA